MAKTFEQLFPRPRGFDGISRPYSPRSGEAARSVRSLHLAEKAPTALGIAEEDLSHCSAPSRQPGDAAGARRLPAIYLSGCRSRRRHTRAMYPTRASIPPMPVRTVPPHQPHFQRAARSTLGRRAKIDWFVPVVADAEAASRPLNAFEIMKPISSGAAGVHFEDQLPLKEVRPHGGNVIRPRRMSAT